MSCFVCYLQNYVEILFVVVSPETAWEPFDCLVCPSFKLSSCGQHTVFRSQFSSQTQEKYCPLTTIRDNDGDSRLVFTQCLS